MNTLADTVERKAPVTGVGAAFARLEAHKLMHRKLLTELGTYYQEFQHSRVVEDKVFRFLTFWLKSHICGIDRQYTRETTKAA